MCYKNDAVIMVKRVAVGSVRFISLPTVSQVDDDDDDDATVKQA